MAPTIKLFYEEVFSKLQLFSIMNIESNNRYTVTIYHGYGHTHNLIAMGHVFLGKPFLRKKYSNKALYNIFHIIQLFFIRPLPAVKVRLKWNEQFIYTSTAADGFFKFEWESDVEVAAGWHPVTVDLLDNKGEACSTGEGKIFIPHSTQYGFISDIDDTVLISHSSSTFKRLRVLFTRNPRTRKAFGDVVKHYQLLSEAHTEPDVPNPFFYVSSSEWNLYNDLNEFFKHNGLPKGAFLLNEIKKWYQLFKTGKTKHHGKLIRVARIINAFPKQHFVLLGDNSQSDPEIYTAVANKFPERIAAIYIRNINKDKQAAAEEMMASLNNKNIATCLFADNEEAILHSKAIGLID
jgi:phosphatidate phosphatase APP1